MSGLPVAFSTHAPTVPGDLQCGTHAPGFYEARGEVPPPPPYSPLAHNCSGKHSGMLAYCVHCGWPKESYLAYDHPLQQSIRRAVAHFTSTPEADLVGGIDGCSAPNYAVPLDRLALGFARLASRDDDAEFGAPPRVLGGKDRRGGRPGHRHPRPRDGNRDQGGRWQQAGVAARDRVGIGAAGAHGFDPAKRSRGLVRTDHPQLPWNRDRTNPVVYCPGQRTRIRSEAVDAARMTPLGMNLERASRSVDASVRRRASR